MYLSLHVVYMLASIRGMFLSIPGLRGCKSLQISARHLEAVSHVGEVQRRFIRGETMPETTHDWEW